jgi:septum formation protein
MTLLLASGSPRRRTLLEWAGYAVDVRPSNADESRDPRHSPVEHARALASLKLKGAPSGRIALAADTVVHSGDRIFEKPVDRTEAAAHLMTLSDRWHSVTTGVAVTGQPVFSVTTEVRFRALSRDEIDRYIATGEADDKAGAYGIQGRAAVFVAEVRGSWTNVVGLPMEATLKALVTAGLTL